ncbi:hypothetical protein AVEN_237201-1 [Araneus ventricosus]|uniref:Uncharacterized protein n=1 Tax=Araneus ventricosus TaxID=182803 RepID=A0A4Y2HXX6_ARAVE|nr:hypothetical protein AVEN_237201-1 [Araneus ventricosus]
MTSLTNKPSHVTMRANEKRPHSLLCRIRKYASAANRRVAKGFKRTVFWPVTFRLTTAPVNTALRVFRFRSARTRAVPVCDVSFQTCKDESRTCLRCFVSDMQKREPYLSAMFRFRMFKSESRACLRCFVSLIQDESRTCRVRFRRAGTRAVPNACDISFPDVQDREPVPVCDVSFQTYKVRAVPVCDVSFRHAKNESVPVCDVSFQTFKVRARYCLRCFVSDVQDREPYLSAMFRLRRARTRAVPVCDVSVGFRFLTMRQTRTRTATTTTSERETGSTTSSSR